MIALWRRTHRKKGGPALIMSPVGCSALLGALLLFLLGGDLAHGQEAPRVQPKKGGYSEAATWRLEFDNDTFFHSDNHLSNILSLQKHSSAAANWDDVSGLPRFFGRLGKHLPFLSGDGLVYRASLAIGQLMQTPDDLHRRDLIRDDVPYAGVLTLQGSWIAYDDDEFRGAEVVIGVLGPPSLAGAAQRAFHRLIDDTVPQGWANQLRTEVLVNLNAMGKKKILRWGAPGGVSFDAAVSGDIGLGNLYTQASGALEMRLGANVPRGFAGTPDLVGFGVSHLAVMRPERPAAPSFYGSLALCGTCLVRSVLIDGNTFRDSHRIQRDTFMGQLIAGLNFESRHFGARFYVVASTALVDTPVRRRERNADRVGTIHLEWRF